MNDYNMIPEALLNLSCRQYFYECKFRCPDFTNDENQKTAVPGGSNVNDQEDFLKNKKNKIENDNENKAA